MSSSVQKYDVLLLDDLEGDNVGHCIRASIMYLVELLFQIPPIKGVFFVRHWDCLRFYPGFQAHWVLCSSCAIGRFNVARRSLLKANSVLR